jgi:hypothetical protein
MAIAEEIIYCDMEYQALSETFRAQITFQQLVSINNPRWSEDDIAVWAKKIEEGTYWRRKAEENRAQTFRKVDTSPRTSGFKGAQIEPTTIRSREISYSCKEPWELDHKYKGKGRVHYIEVHYDSDDEDVYEVAFFDTSLEQAIDSCASNGQLDGQDDSACALVSRSDSVEDSTLHHSGDTLEDVARSRVSP